MSIRIKEPGNFEHTDLSLVNIDDQVHLCANNIPLLWFDENDWTVNFCIVQEHAQALLPGLSFTEDRKLKVYQE